jgi:D-alanyl-D-alanine carboxypeptidase
MSLSSRSKRAQSCSCSRPDVTWCGVGKRELGARLERSGLAQQVCDLDLPGVVVRISEHSGTPWSAAFGTADVASHRSMTAGSRMRVGSVGKMFTATLVLQLIDRGQLDLDSTLTAVLPEFGWLPSADLITIRHLLSMRSGIYDYTETEASERLFFPADQHWGHAHLVELVRDHDPNGMPGEFRYSSTNYALLGLLAERLTGLSYSRALHPLLEQVGLTSTYCPTGSKIEGLHARGYLRATGASTEQLRHTAAIPGQLRFRDVTSIAASAGGAAGGLVSTAADLDMFIRAVARGSLLSERLHREQLDLQPVGSDDLAYGLGIASYRQLVGHEGNLPGYSSYIGQDLNTGLTIAVLANCADAAGGASLMLLVDHIIDVIDE